VRSTTKYWVRTTDVSAVKHHVLQHLPVFQFEKSVRFPHASHFTDVSGRAMV